MIACEALICIVMGAWCASTTLGDLSSEASPSCLATTNDATNAVYDYSYSARSSYSHLAADHDQLAADWRSAVGAANTWAVLTISNGALKAAHATFVLLESGAGDNEASGLARVAKGCGVVASLICFIFAIVFVVAYGSVEDRCAGTAALEQLDGVWILVVVAMILSLCLMCGVFCVGGTEGAEGSTGRHGF